MILVSLEGIEGAGKTSVLAALERRGSPRLVCAGELLSPIGPILRERLADLTPIERVYWFAADRASTLGRVQASLAPDSRIVVVWDRYLESAWAYRSAEIELGLAPPETLDLVRKVNDAFPQPDKVIFLDIDPVVAAARLAQIGRASDARMRGALDYYRRRATEVPGLYVSIDSNRPIDDVAGSVVQQLNEDYGEPHSKL